jgi:hypothetical protein
MKVTLILVTCGNLGAGTSPLIIKLLNYVAAASEIPAEIKILSHRTEQNALSFIL